MNTLAKLIATGLGSGYMPVAPGTAGAALAVIITYFIATLSAGPAELDIYLGILSVVFTILGIWSANVLQDEWGHDPGKIVVDEMVGIWISMLFIPFSIINLLLAFGLFRLYDIWKPWIVKKAENLDGGLGVMADDIVAGLFANVTLQFILIVAIKYL